MENKDCLALPNWSFAIPDDLQALVMPSAKLSFTMRLVSWNCSKVTGFTIFNPGAEPVTIQFPHDQQPDLIKG